MSESRKTVVKSVTLRRQDRAVVDEEWIERMLETAPYATMAMNGKTFPHISMNVFYYDRSERSIYFHTAKAGTTRTIVGNGTKVTFTVSSMGRLLPAKTATHMSVEYWSVMVRGEIGIVDDSELAQVKMSKFVEKYFPHLKAGSDYELISTEEIANISVYRISISEWIGKRKRERDDFPGAFVFGKGNVARE